MAEAEERQIVFSFRMLDNVSATAAQIKQGQQDLKTATDNTTKSIDSQNISFLAQVTAMRSVYSGVGILASSLSSLNLIGKDTANMFGTMQSMIGLAVGSFNLLKGGAQIVTLLARAEAQLAVIETYRVTLKNPLVAAGVGIAVGAAAVVGATYLSQSSSQTNNVTQNNVFSQQPTQNQRATSTATLSSIGGVVR